MDPLSPQGSRPRAAARARPIKAKPSFRRLLRSTTIIAHDGMMAALSFFAALALRLGDNPLAYSQELVVKGTILFTAVALVVFWTLGLHRGVWRYTSMPDVLRIMKAAGLAILIFLLFLFLVTRLEGLPRTMLGIQAFVLVALLAGSRILYRLIQDRGREGLFRPLPTADRIPVLLIGAGDEAEMFLRATAANTAARYHVVGLVATGASRVGRQIRGTEVLGSLDRLETVIESLDADGLRPHRIIVSDPGLTGAPLAALLSRAEALGVDLARLPRLTDFRAGAETGIEPRSVDIADLLGRPQQVLDRGAMAQLIRGKRVLITGAGGSIGGELVRQVVSFAPDCLFLIDHAEYALYRVEQDLEELAPDIPRQARLADVRNREEMFRLVAGFAPDLVFHAAALKHLPIVESHPEEGVRTNIGGTRNMADACLAAGVRAMVLISTDKAVNPSSVMGASKRAAERYCQALNLAARDGNGQRAAGRTRFITVRFGNVLGSTGSVVPLFQRQLARGGPLTVTHPAMTRYFMTVREAVELVLEATVLGSADDLGEAIFVLDMGAPVRILDMARQMIRLAGLRPDEDIRIVFTGLRPGEKLAEELFHQAEPSEKTRYPGVLIAHPRAATLNEITPLLETLDTAEACHDTGRLIETLKALVPEYTPADTVDSSSADPSSAAAAAEGARPHSETRQEGS